MSTRHRRSEELALTDNITIDDDGPMIVATVLVPGCTPERALAAFTNPALVTRWWRGELTAELMPGGDYIVEFAAIGVRLTGQVLSYAPDQSLEFSWSWDDDPPDSTVTITAEPGLESGSTLLTLTHGPHAKDAAGQAAHQEHWEGWEFFLPRLVTELRQGPKAAGGFSMNQ
jgi:uncharacterized protein YndB with AHSA1/START domain